MNPYFNVCTDYREKGSHADVRDDIREDSELLATGQAFIAEGKAIGVQNVE